MQCHLDPLVYEVESNRDLFTDALHDENATFAEHSLQMAPILTEDALSVAGDRIFSQRAYYGRIIEQDFAGFPKIPKSRKVFVNSGTSFSAVVCGAQGRGKSHSTAVLLESCLIADHRLGAIPSPLSALVFYFDSTGWDGNSKPCELAHLAWLDDVRGQGVNPPNVTVLVLPSSLSIMTELYAEEPNVIVEALHFAPEDISREGLLAIMNVNPGNISLPGSYLEPVMSILCDMDSFDYHTFRRRLDASRLTAAQKFALQQRLDMLDMCMKDGNVENHVKRHFRPGHSTIVDFFDMILGLFDTETIERGGKLVVLDEAHQYLPDNGVPCRFTDTFQSPVWFDHLLRHMPTPDGDMRQPWFDKIITLRTGQAMLFAPADVGCRQSHWDVTSEWWGRDIDAPATSQSLVPLGRGYILVQSRQRVTRDGDKTVLAARSSSLRAVFQGPQDIAQAFEPREVSTPALVKLVPEEVSVEDLPDPSEDEGSIAVSASASSSAVGFGIINTAPTTVKASHQRFHALLSFLEQRRIENVGSFLLPNVEARLRELHEDPFDGQTIEDHVHDAFRLFLVRSGGEMGDTWVELGRYGPLVLVMQDLRRTGNVRPTRSAVLEQLEKHDAVAKPPGRFFHTAEKLGIIRRDNDRIVLLSLHNP
ncbi:hypothetical protein PUNSTDRAFT_130308 [Punctularia strigosozonata HHB-11173 SS5]|uniref:uncharacterized protein n=1 Tax=Punctularia strigosozonata (strain HHB-11173) TaxID=741275 RepID=UPI0004416830|nr:uncharacterized protein PUNSTDRAFT_130308 [Punctularia strigosozonata HHB-11173 SS5]EIN14685.1 hypothetical protein PUNSTDRAFT_130308 [Punctularia strigosozonata HHB-11173 SS5]